MRNQCEAVGKSANSKLLVRRRLLKASASIIVGASTPLILNAKPSAPKNLAFLNLHTNESAECCYWEHGRFNQDSLADFNHVLRDHRTNEIYPIDTELLDLLYTLHKQCNSDSPFHVISAYRSEKSNEMLRKTSNGVAKKSMHMLGQAIDIRLPDVELSTLRDTAISLNSGGVGYYKSSNFIHIDIGRPRYW